MSPFFFIAPAAIVVIAYMVLRSQSQGSKARPTSKTEKSPSELPIFPFIDQNEQSAAIQTATDRHSYTDHSTTPNSCNDAITATVSSSATSNWDPGPSSCGIDSSPSPSVDTNNY